MLLSIFAFILVLLMPFSAFSFVTGLMFLDLEKIKETTFNQWLLCTTMILGGLTAISIPIWYIFTFKSWVLLAFLVSYFAMLLFLSLCQHQEENYPSY